MNGINVRYFQGFSVLGLLVAGAAIGACKSKEVAHRAGDSVYQLRGLHAALPCDACHTSGFSKLPQACGSCHEDDRPADITHDQLQDCFACHTEDGWEIVETTTLPPTGDTAPPVIEPDPDPAFDHTGLLESLCWDCHEEDRKPGYHYNAEGSPPVSWDCGGCHTATAWDWKPVVHPARVPHGARIEDCTPKPDENTWQIGCVGCHPDGTADKDNVKTVCFACHDSEADPVHNGLYEEDGCLDCHESAEPEDCN